MNIELLYCPRCQQCQTALREVAIWHDPRDSLLAPQVEVLSRCWHCGQEIYRHVAKGGNANVAS